MKVVAFCDGGARGNPGPAGIGVTIRSPRGKVLGEISEAIGHATNNVAEYTAVLRALGRARELGATEVEIVTDSKLLVEQLNGRYRVKNPTLRRLNEEVRAAAKSFGSVSYRHVRRERNKRADALVNLAVDAWLAENPDLDPPEEEVQTELF
ncbi:MAG: ribonuclease HI family protein [Actinomycetota bacterium]